MARGVRRLHDAPRCDECRRPALRHKQKCLGHNDSDESKENAGDCRMAATS